MAIHCEAAEQGGLTKKERKFMGKAYGLASDRPIGPPNKKETSYLLRTPVVKILTQRMARCVNVK